MDPADASSSGRLRLPPPASASSGARAIDSARPHFLHPPPTPSAGSQALAAVEMEGGNNAQLVLGGGGINNNNAHLVLALLGGGGITFDAGIVLADQTWMHSVFACPLHMDECISITEFANTTDLVQSDISIPGCNDVQKKVSRALPILLRLLRQWYEVSWRVRRAGFSLRGNFSCANFLVYRPKQKHNQAQLRGSDNQDREQHKARRPAEDRLIVRMTGRLHLSRYSPEDGVQDDRTFVWSVRELLNIREHVPVGISDWLNLINSRGVGHEYLVRYHIHLMDPRAGLSVLMSFRKRLDYLRSRKPDVYATVLNMMVLFQGWNGRVNHFDNALMEDTRLYILNQSGRTQEDGFEPNIGGILKVIRDCSEHKAKKLEQFMLLIIDEDFGAVAAQLQFVMFRTGQLQSFHLENTMGG